ncbi:L-2-amino-thiazoline-4-carboxylic acid hydrolase [Clostridium oryzae]|uniref:L-2-amino-thiazoline-4-carboxylic acid hydrolase n=1 Tax=Clostridium oryzae TaxID=1450648 RepID=A0A1V4IVQ1_9CLOT|nr:L-2-amino-thiazoline-4-carboxylic acid hydrolase [Clostridium oryzae]OPJ64026.1 hypothetical protein CLORY_08980 [Clostridium oryzae]
MSFSETRFHFFYDECIRQFGAEQGKRIFEIADRKLAEMKNEADYRNSKAIKEHMNTNLLPTIAIYSAFLQSNFTKENAYEKTLEITQIAAKVIQKKNEFVGKIPFGYNLFKMFCKSVMNKNYPKEGWSIVWQRYDKQEIHFDMTSCIYMETTKRYNCPELCPVFCANDITTFAGYRPNIIFERNGTIGQGQKVCDFHLQNSKFKIKR